MTEKQAETLQQVATDVAVLKGAILGNGTRGLGDRVSDLEEWRHASPRANALQDHIEQTVDTPKQRTVNGWSIFWGIIGAVGVFGSLAVAVLK